MKAIIQTKYGASDVVELSSVDRPAVDDDRVLVRVNAASINPYDWHMVTGTPYFMRLSTGLRSPKQPRLGQDLAGRIEQVGSNVTRFSPGDDVLGVGVGALAEYVAPVERQLVAKPPSLTYEQAAAVPLAAITALQGLRDKGELQAGQRVLINGASGGVGTFAVQIAKRLGADVTAVCSTRNAGMVRSLGADRVVDYTREDFTAAPHPYDVILDNMGNRPLSACKKILTNDGRYVLVGGPKKGRWLGPMRHVMRGAVRFAASRKKFVFLVARITLDDLTAIRRFLESGELVPVIDRRYELEDARDALEYLAEGHAQGKVVIRVAS